MATPNNDLLQSYYRAKYPDLPGLRVSELTNITTGWECEVFSFLLERSDDQPGEALVLRLYAGDDRIEKCQKEFFILNQLAQIGYPVPQVYILEKDHSPFDKPFIIMEKIDGRDMWQAFTDAAQGGLDSPAIIALLRQFCELPVRLHALDWRLFAPIAPGDPGASPFYTIDRVLDYGQGATAAYPSAGIQALVDWLAARRETLACDRPALVHFDYHPGNLLVRADGSAVVIDWTATTIFDPRMDLGWTLLLTAIYAGPDLRNAFLTGYERLSGRRVEQVEVFEVIACLRRMIDILVSVRMGPEKLGMRPGVEALMKQQAGPLQKVYDLQLRHTGIRIAEIESLIQSFMLE
jgi:aminoglycoside phosphotransferase (APT) family kinase protein